MNAERVLLPACVLLELNAFEIQNLLIPAPQFMPNCIPDTQFSGERALSILESNLAINNPHPEGSEANKKVKERNGTSLTGHAIEPEVRYALGCHLDRGCCAWTENMTAKVPSDTDVTVAKRNGGRVADIGFAGACEHSHILNDWNAPGLTGTRNGNC